MTEARPRAVAESGRGTPLLASAAAFPVGLDTTAVNVTLPDIRRDLGTLGAGALRAGARRRPRREGAANAAVTSGALAVLVLEDTSR
jgi:hypothetical protein